MTRIGDSVWVAQLAAKLWLHTSTSPLAGGGVFPANGLILEHPEGCVLIDTGYSGDQAEVLVRWAKRTLPGAITLAVATHFHRDRIGGLVGLKDHGIRTIAHPLTRTLALEHDLPPPEAIEGFGDGAYSLRPDCELFFPGAGHTRDNIVVWMPRQQALFGGCMLKSVTSRDLGNLAEAVVPDWRASVARVQARYEARKITVPGHGTIAGDSIAHTLALL